MAGKNITSVEWSSPDLPAGLSINKDTGVITGTPTVQPPVTLNATIKVKTNYGEDTKTIEITVKVPAAWMPLITAGQTIEVIADENMTPYQVQGTNTEKTS